MMGFQSVVVGTRVLPGDSGVSCAATGLCFGEGSLEEFGFCKASV